MTEAPDPAALADWLDRYKRKSGITVTPSDFLALRDAVALRGSGDLEGAARAFEHAERAGIPGAATGVGEVLFEMGDAARAEAAFRRDDKRRVGPAATLHGMLLAERGAEDRALAAFCRGDQYGDAGAAYNVGCALVERGCLDEAAVAFARADERGHDRAVFNLAVVLLRRRHHAAAKDAFARAAQGEPRSERRRAKRVLRAWPLVRGLHAIANATGGVTRPMCPRSVTDGTPPASFRPPSGP